jgi:hypothetical protein
MSAVAYRGNLRLSLCLDRRLLTCDFSLSSKTSRRTARLSDAKTGSSFCFRLSVTSSVASSSKGNLTRRMILVFLLTSQDQEASRAAGAGEEGRGCRPACAGAGSERRPARVRNDSSELVQAADVGALVCFQVGMDERQQSRQFSPTDPLAIPSSRRASCPMRRRSARKNWRLCCRSS